MNNPHQPIKEQDIMLKRKLLLVLLFIAYPAYILQSCAISPMYTITDSNILYSGLLSLFFYFLGILVDIFVIFLSLATVIYGLHKFSLRDMRSVITLALMAPVFKNILKITVSPLIDGVIDIDLFLMDLYTLTVSSILEMLQLSVILFIAYRPIKRYRAQLLVIDKASERLGKENVPDMRLIPFKKPISVKNPLQYGALVSVIVVTLVRILMRIINDTEYLSSVTFDMLFFLPYILALISGVCGYLLMIYTFISLEVKNKTE